MKTLKILSLFLSLTIVAAEINYCLCLRAISQTERTDSDISETLYIWGFEKDWCDPINEWDKVKALLN
jgi:hypothetical protein